MTIENKPASGQPQPIVGAAPAGARDEASASVAVRDMFTSIAPRYDLLNHVLSMNVDRVWWNRTARMFSDVLASPRRAGARPVLRHRRHDLRAASPHERRRTVRRGFLSRHAGARRAEVGQPQDQVDRSRRAESAFCLGPVSTRDLGIRLPQPGELQSRTRRDFPRARARRRGRHSRLRRTEGADRQNLSPVLQASAAGDRHNDLRR